MLICHLAKMLRFVFLLCLCPVVFGSSFLGAINGEENLFEEYVTKFNKHYPTPEALQTAYANFIANRLVFGDVDFQQLEAFLDQPLDSILYEHIQSFSGLQGFDDGIDRSFMEAVEGFKTTGYVPSSGNSGVTIGTGVDLGQRSSLTGLDIDQNLKAKLSPYLGKTGSAAVSYLQQHPLSLSLSEARSLDRAVQTPMYQALATRYNADISGGKPLFQQLPRGIQTAIYSVNYQYGNAKVKCPKFWSAAVSQEWELAVDELRHFGDAYPTRRNKEADLIQNAL
eukprot:GILK01006088.1.p1 GENE.GILK01006088.1~~GILK01006088.1.p1  ORF type:complete len:282 (+),score=48.28 GILK01006088.1:73-918(+)